MGNRKTTEKINGMFPFCIWDNSLRQLIILETPLALNLFLMMKTHLFVLPS